MLVGKRRRSNRLAALAAAVGASSLALVGLGAQPAAADSGSGPSAAIVTPLLKTMDFGDAVGMPLLCAAASSILASASTQTSTLVTTLNSQCLTLSQQGHAYLQQAIANSSALAGINPVVNPVLAGLANGLQSLGSTSGSSLAPLGPFIAGSGNIVAFYEGS
jgi:hypothetical protein